MVFARAHREVAQAARSPISGAARRRQGSMGLESPAALGRQLNKRSWLCWRSQLKCAGLLLWGRRVVDCRCHR
jgi:hypothetical protein